MKLHYFTRGKMGRYDHIGRYFQYCIKLRGKTYLISLMLNIYWSQTEKQTRRWKSKCFQQTNNVLSYLLRKFMWKWKKISLSLSIVESLMIFPVVGLTWFCHCCNNLPKVYCHWNNFTMLFAFVSRHVDIFIIWCNNCLEFYLLNFQAPWPLWSALALKGTWNPFGVLKYPLFQILLFEG